MVQQRTASEHRPVTFGRFRLDPAQQQLFEANQAVRIGGRAFEILTALVEQAGELVTKDELMARVWPNAAADDGALRVHVAALRRTLGDGQDGNRFIINVPGRGYRFVAPVSLGEGIAPPEPAPAAVDLPASLARIVGRSKIVEALAARSPQQRLITIAGPGGIGKTTVAVAVAQGLRGTYPDGVHLVELAPIADAKLVPSAVAATLGLGIRSDDPVPSLLAFLAPKKMLIVLDNCEHVIGAAAALAAALTNGTAGVHLVATSREPLRVQGEHVHRLTSLDVPPGSAAITAAEAMKFAAIQLFVERAAAVQDSYALSDDDAPVVSEICRQLDGIALAIELAAGRTDALGVRGVAARLDKQFQLLTRGKRTALPRHSTLGATLDWSYQLLTPEEQAVTRRLALFAGAFSLDAASVVAVDDAIAPAVVMDCIANLVAKSLVVADVSGPVAVYRFLNTTRAYGLERLTESGELQSVARRHAQYFLDQYQGFLAQWEAGPTVEWVAARRGELDNVRAALDWAFSAEGDKDIGIALVIAAIPLWLHLSLVTEGSKRVEQALASRDAASDPRRDMQLFAGLGATLIYTSMGPAAHEAWLKALKIAEDEGDVGYQLRALWGLWVDRLNVGAFRESLILGQRFIATAAKSSEPMDVLMGERILGVSLHFLGDQNAARQHLERMLAGYRGHAHHTHIVRFQFDQHLTARCFLARILWTQGFADQAMRIVDGIVADAVAINHALSACNALGQGACVVAAICGDLARAERYAAMLLDQSARHSLALWNAWGRCFQGILVATRGNLAEGVKQLRAELSEFPATRALPRYLFLHAELARLLGLHGEFGQALALIDETLARIERNEELWSIPEALRIKGRLLALQRKDDAAEEHFARALEWARKLQTPAWALRVAISLARLQRQQGRDDEARALLLPIYRGFTEGFGTLDLKTAKRLVDDLS